MSTDGKLQTDAIIIRLATPADTEQVLATMRYGFGERESINPDWYRWYNYDCPTGASRNYIAIEKPTGQFVALWALLPIRIKYNEAIIDGSLSANVATHPDYRGKGIFSHLGKWCLGQEYNYGSKVTFGVPNQNSYTGHVKMGWHLISYLSFFAKTSFRNMPYKSKEVQLFDSRVDRLTEQIISRTNLAIVKDHRFLNWRYPQRPDKRYSLFIFENKGNIDGYIVVKKYDETNYRKTHILDIMATNKVAFDDLILAAESFATGRDVLNCWQIDNSIYQEYFMDNGFTIAEQKNPLMYHNNYGEEINFRPPNWWFSLGDNDVY